MCVLSPFYSTYSPLCGYFRLLEVSREQRSSWTWQELWGEKSSLLTLPKSPAFSTMPKALPTWAWHSLSHQRWALNREPNTVKCHHHQEPRSLNIMKNDELASHISLHCLDWQQPGDRRWPLSCPRALRSDRKQRIAQRDVSSCTSQYHIKTTTATTNVSPSVDMVLL